MVFGERMKEDHSNNEIDVDPELLSVLLQNPYLLRPEDEIGQTALVKWVEREYKSSTGTTVKKQEVYGLITKLILNHVFVGKRYGQRLLLKPTHNYYLLKNGQQIVRKKTDRAQVSLFKNDGDCSFVRNIESHGDNKTRTFTVDHDGIPTASQFPPGSNISYKALLLDKIRHYDGPDKDLVKYLPAFFNLACNILNDRYTDWHTKILISSVLGYFILEDDVIADNTEFG